MHITPYKRFQFTERETVSRGLAAKQSIRSIAKALGRSPSTLSREVNGAGMCAVTYRAEQGQRRASAQTHTSRRSRKLEECEPLRTYVHTHLVRDWSPEEIAKRIQKEYPGDMMMRVSHETIYTYLYCLPRGELKKELISHLRQERKTRKNRKLVHDKRGQIPDMISIEERPQEVETRTVPGHWEGDLILGADHQSALGTLVERTTRTTLLVPLKAKDAVSVRIAFAKHIKTLPEAVRLTLTYDRGKEMTEHRLFTKETKMQVYFAHPQSPWERGTNENTNGLVRQYFPKGTDFRKVTRKRIKEVQDLLNTRPRKVLDFFTPQETMKSILTNQPVALEV